MSKLKSFLSGRVGKTLLVGLVVLGGQVAEAAGFGFGADLAKLLSVLVAGS